jgi:FkbM family methyltransferase
MKLYQRIARLFGYEVIKCKKHPTLQSHLLNLIEQYDIDLILDVGANRGQFAEGLWRQGYRGEIHSFEPVAENVRILEQKRGTRQDWHVHPVALGDRPGSTVIHVTQASDLSSILSPNEFGRQRCREHIHQVAEQTVDVWTIDDALRKHVPDAEHRRILLKMDTQGYDLNVFAGSAEHRSSIRCILTELSLIPIYEGMPHYLDALRTFEDAGFAVTGLYPVTRNADFSLVEMDCVLVNRATTPDAERKP